MLTEGNTKLGMLIWGWSIPALHTCPGASEVCKLVCYAMTGFFVMPSVEKAHDTNLRATRSKEFVPWMIQQIKLNFVRVVRIHVAGDFYNRQYIKRWLKIVRSCPDVKFYAYTRSWAKVEFLDLLIELGREPNMTLYFSWDRSMSFPPKRKGIRTCYLSQDDTDFPRRKTDLVFRDDPQTPMKHDPVGNLICPYDNEMSRGVNCSLCGICWNKQLLNKTSNQAQEKNHDNNGCSRRRSRLRGRKEVAHA